MSALQQQKTKKMPAKPAVRPIQSERIKNLFVDVTFETRIQHQKRPKPSRKAGKDVEQMVCTLRQKPVAGVGPRMAKGEPQGGTLHTLNRIMASGDRPLTDAVIMTSTGSMRVLSATRDQVVMVSREVGNVKPLEMSLSRWAHWISANKAKILFAESGHLFEGIPSGFTLAGESGSR